MSADTPTTTFADLGLPDSLLAALREVGYETPSPIQAATIPALLAGRDMIGQHGSWSPAEIRVPLVRFGAFAR